MNKGFVFKPRARLLLQLGDQLIRNESIALLELIKNSYDADATVVKVKLLNLDDPAIGQIVIEDNGTGMNLDIVRNVWMEPGSDYKERLIKEGIKSKKFKRTPLGEKGIGRFGAHKLGSKIQLITKMEDEKEVRLNLDWTRFAETEYLEDVGVTIVEREARVFTQNRTGTRIVIKELKKTWNRGMVRELYRGINSLCSPFDTPDSFRIITSIDNEDLIEGLIKWEDVKDYALFSVNCELQRDEITKFEYNFKPWASMNKLEPRSINEKDAQIAKIKRIISNRSKKETEINLDDYDIGVVQFEAIIFDLDSKTLSLGVQDKKGLKEYLKLNGGIRVFRDGVRVYDYGEPGNDWLNLGERRVNVPVKRISNNIVIGAVNLSRKQSTGLKEKTNREGFVDNEAYQALIDAITYIIELVETQRNIDKEKIRIIYGPQNVSEPVVSNLHKLKDLIKDKVKEEKTQVELFNYIERIEGEYKRANEILLRSAGAGLSLSVVIHEVDKIIAELTKAIQREDVPDRIVNLVKHLSQLVDGYEVIIRNSKAKVDDLKTAINQAVFNIEFRLEDHGIQIIREYLNKKKTLIRYVKPQIIATIVNLLDNSIYWLERYKIENKKIIINISDEVPGYINIVIADNGLGFALPTESIINPFVSAKKDGVGLGLHIANEIMKAHNGELIFPGWGDFKLPNEFKKGAVIALAFRNEDMKNVTTN